MTDPALLKAARRVMYVCVDYEWVGGAPGVEARNCVDCGKTISVTTRQMRAKQEEAHAAGVTLAVVCHDCALAEAAKSPLAIVELPPPEEMFDD